MNTAPLHRALLITAWIAGLFCLLVCGVMVYEHFAAATRDPWKSPQLLALKEKLAAEPGNVPLQMEIRQLDQAFRQKFRHRLSLDKTGAWLALGGMLALVLAAGQSAALRKTLPLPQPKIAAAEQSAKRASRARWSLAGVGLAVAASLVIIGLDNTSVLPANQAAWQKLTGQAGAEETPAETAPALSEFQANWPRFRGWDGSGASAQTNYGTNLAWRSAIPAPGHSSPVVWGERVFISGGTAARREVFCYSVSSGALLWRRAVENVPGSPPKVAEVPADTTYAAPTLATDGRRVYVFFANGDLAALAFDGSVAWTKYLGPLKNPYGYAASLAVWGNNLLLQLDQGGTTAEGSKLISLQGASGRVLWERSRPVPASWATPIVIEAAGKTQIITLANPWVIAYTQADGAELWRAQVLEGEVVPSPIFAGGYVILANPGSALLALRPDGSGRCHQDASRVVFRGERPRYYQPGRPRRTGFHRDQHRNRPMCRGRRWQKNLGDESGHGSQRVARHRGRPAVDPGRKRRRGDAGGRARVSGNGANPTAGQIPRQPGLRQRAHLPARSNQPVLPGAGRRQAGETTVTHAGC